jgi:hypothetical protein
MQTTDGVPPKQPQQAADSSTFGRKDALVRVLFCVREVDDWNGPSAEDSLRHLRPIR